MPAHVIDWAFALGAAGFSSAVMLFWAAAAAIPIILHFLNRKRRQQRAWAAMQILKEVIERRSKRIRIEQLLLLLLRVAIVLCFALALSRPFWNSKGAGEGLIEQRDPKLWIVALDTSYSMQTGGGGTSRFQRISEKVVEQLDASLPGDAFALINIGQPARSVISRPTFDKSALLRELRQLTAVDTGSDLAGGFSLVETVIDSRQEGQLAEIEKIEVLLGSDLGEDQWKGVLDGELGKAYAELQTKAKVQVISDPEPNPPENLAVTRVEMTADQVLQGATAEVVATVENYSQQPKRVTVQLQDPVRTIASRDIQIPAFQEQQVRFEFAAEQLGRQAIKVKIDDDDLDVDNSRFAVFVVREQFSFLFVENIRDDSRLFRIALQPEMSSEQLSLDVVDSNELAGVRLDSFDVVSLQDLPAVSRSTFERLSSYVEGGGALLINLGEKADVVAWNRSLADFGFQLDGPSEYSDWTLDPRSYASPVTKPFEGFADAGLLTTPIFRYWKSTVSNSEATVDIGMSSGDPLLVRMPVGKGQLGISLSAPDDGRDSAAWNAMGTWPSFLPLVQNLFAALASVDDQQHTLLTSEPLVGKARLDGGSSGPLVRISRPNGVEVEMSTSPTADAKSAWIFLGTDQAGLYTATSEDQTDVFAVNINPIESSLKCIARKALPEVRDLQSQSTEKRSVIPSQDSQDNLARVLLVLLFCMLLGESAFAWFLGRRIG